MGGGGLPLGSADLDATTTDPLVVLVADWLLVVLDELMTASPVVKRISGEIRFSNLNGFA